MQDNRKPFVYRGIKVTPRYFENGIMFARGLVKRVWMLEGIPGNPLTWATSIKDAKAKINA